MTVNEEPNGKRLYILYDARACGDQGTDDAAVLCTAGTDSEARGDAKMYGETACYSYAILGKNLEDERWKWDTNSRGKVKK